MADEATGHDAPEQSREELRERAFQSERQPDSAPLLGYRTPPSPPEGETGFAFAGFVVGGAVVAVAGYMAWVMAVVRLMQTGKVPAWAWLFVGTFAVIAIASLFARRRLSRASQPTKRSAFAAGLLMGVGVTALVEGACFTLTSMS